MKIYLNQLKKIKKITRSNNINKASFGPTNTIVSAYVSIDIIMTLINQKKYIGSLNRIKTIDFFLRMDNEEKRF